MLKNNFEAKMYLKMLLVNDRNNSIAEVYEKIVGRRPNTAYEVITNEKYLSYCVDISKPFEVDEMGIDRALIKQVLKQKLHSMYL